MGGGTSSRRRVCFAWHARLFANDDSLDILDQFQRLLLDPPSTPLPLAGWAVELEGQFVQFIRCVCRWLKRMAVDDFVAIWTMEDDT
jgi:hypothetical protein